MLVANTTFLHQDYFLCRWTDIFLLYRAESLVFHEGGEIFRDWFFRRAAVRETLRVQIVSKEAYRYS